MHEYSIVQSLLDSCQEYAKENSATKITKVVVKIGVMSGVEPHLLEVAFETFKEDSICSEAEFIMHIQALLVECNDCKKTSELEKTKYCCPHCESYNLKVLDGEDMFLMSLEMDT